MTRISVLTQTMAHFCRHLHCNVRFYLERRAQCISTAASNDNDCPFLLLEEESSPVSANILHAKPPPVLLQLYRHPQILTIFYIILSSGPHERSNHSLQGNNIQNKKRRFKQK